MNNASLVSCICVSYNRPKHLRRAISHFVAQTYPEKELIIVSAGHNPEYEEMVAECEGNAVKYYCLDATLTLGELRNQAIEKAAGDYICVWDDDDWYHVDRISAQMRDIRRVRKSGAILPYCLLYDVMGGVAYMSSPRLLHTASIICKKDVFAQGVLYASLNRGEDMLMFAKLVRSNKLFPVVNPLLYIYVFHQKNTTDSDQFEYMFRESTRLSPKLSEKIGDMVEGKYSSKEGSEILESNEVYEELNYLAYLSEYVMPLPS
jgi:glycosyltransferase involved in cell wall biosynthesis